MESEKKNSFNLQPEQISNKREDKFNKFTQHAPQRDKNKKHEQDFEIKPRLQRY